MPLLTIVVNGLLDTYDEELPYLSIHIDDPAGTGAHEVVGGSYYRQLLAWSPAVGGIKVAAPAIFQIPAGAVITHCGTWSALSGGAFRGGAPLPGTLASRTFAVAGPYSLTVAAAADPQDLSAIPWIDVREHGAVADGTTDDAPAIQAALDAAPWGSVVQLHRDHAVGSALVVPPGVEIVGLHGGHIDTLESPTLIALASFTDDAVIMMVDQATGGYATASCEQRITRVSIDADAATGSVRGIRAVGFVHGVYITDVAIRRTPGNGLSLQSNGSGTPYSWHTSRLHVFEPGGFGINASMTDGTWIDCEVLGAGIYGWTVVGAANSTFIGCRSEWSTQAGWSVTGSTGTGQGSGGFSFIGCSTDRNGQHGWTITATGNGPINLVGCTTRRDGRLSVSAGYAGINIASATAPVVIAGATCYPGVNDDGTGLNTPQYGLSFTGCTLVGYSGSIFHAASAGVHDGGSNARVMRGGGVAERVGTTSSYTESASVPLLAGNSLSDVASVATARTNLGLGGAAILAVGTTAGTVAAGDRPETILSLLTPVEWTASTAYSVGQMLTHLGFLYRVTTAHTSGGSFSYANLAMLRAPIPGSPIIAGSYSMCGVQITSSAATLGNGTLRLSPWYLPNPTTLTRIGAEVTIVGDVGSKFRLGIYADNGALQPGALILDAGQVAGDAVAVPELTISQVMLPGIYWVGGAPQSITVTQPTLRTTVASGFYPPDTTKPAADAGVACWAQTGVTGALPNPFVPGFIGGSAARVFVKGS